MEDVCSCPLCNRSSELDPKTNKPSLCSSCQDQMEFDNLEQKIEHRRRSHFRASSRRD